MGELPVGAEGRFDVCQEGECEGYRPFFFQGALELFLGGQGHGGDFILWSYRPFGGVAVSGLAWSVEVLWFVGGWKMGTVADLGPGCVACSLG